MMIHAAAMAAAARHSLHQFSRRPVMMSRRRPHSDPGCPPAGYVLLEIIIALTVFAVAIAGLTAVLHSSLDSANALRRSAAVRRGMEALLVEARQKPKREEMALAATDPILGIEYRSGLDELKWVNRRGEPVRGLYLLRVEARDVRGGGAGRSLEPTDVAEVYVYRP